MIIGVMEDTPHSTQRCVIPPGARLYVLCDGCYEIRNASGEMTDYNAFEDFMTGNAGATDPLGDLESWAIAMRGESTLEDDFSIIEIQFPA
jgi:serine phosphatase RsbU (regulator of sigma subunit)